MNNHLDIYFFCVLKIHFTIKIGIERERVNCETRVEFHSNSKVHYACNQGEISASEQCCCDFTAPCVTIAF